MIDWLYGWFKKNDEHDLEPEQDEAVMVDEETPEPSDKDGSEPEPDVNVVRIRDAQAMLDPPLFNLFREALMSNPLSDVRAGIPQVMNVIHLPHVGVLCARENGEWQSLALVELAKGLTDGAIVLHFFNRGSSAARNVLIAGVLQFAKEGGAKRLFGIDMNGNLAAFRRVFRAGNPVKEHGALVEFDLTEDSE